MEGLCCCHKEEKMTIKFSGKVGLIQRVKPNYRVPFFEELALRCEDGFSLAAGQPLGVESIPDQQPLQYGELFKTENIHFFNPSHSLYMCYQKGLLGWLEKFDPGALIVEANFRYLSSYAAIRWMKERGRLVIGWGLGASVNGGIMDYSRNSFIRQFDALIAYSTKGAREYIMTGFPSDRVYVARNAVGGTFDFEQGIDPFSKRSTHPLMVLFVGRLQKRKKIDLLIKAIASIEEQTRPNLTIVGAGPELNNLQKLANSLPLVARFTGYLDGEELKQEYLSANLFVLPGTGGLAVQQAMSFGLPVIVEEGDGTQTDLVSEENGWLLRKGNLDELTDVLRLALSSPDRLSQMGLASHKTVRNEINIQKMADVFVEVLNHLTHPVKKH